MMTKNILSTIHYYVVRHFLLRFGLYERLTLWNSEQKNVLLIKLNCFSFDFDETWWSCSYPHVLQFHQVSSKLDEKEKRFINSPFFCSEFQSVSRIMKIVQRALILKACISGRLWLDLIDSDQMCFLMSNLLANIGTNAFHVTM